MDKNEALKTIDDVNKFCVEGLRENMDWDGVHKRFKELPKIAQEFPELTDNILITYETSLQSDNVDGWSIMYIFDGLNQILKDKPELCDRCFDLHQLYIKSNKPNTLYTIEQYEPDFKMLNNILEMKPDIVDDVVDFYAVVLKKENLSLAKVAFSGFNLNNFLNTHPNAADRVVYILEEYLQSGISDKQFDYNRWSDKRDPLNTIYEILGNAAVLKPELIDKVSEVYKSALSFNRKYHFSFYNDTNESAYKPLSYIIENHAELSDKVFDIFETAMLYDKNDPDTLERAYKTLGNILQSRPELSDKILKLLKIGIESCENDSETLKRIYANLDKIIQIKPEMADEVLNIFKMALESEANNGKYLEYYGNSSLGLAYKTLGNILQSRPELSDKIFEMFKFCSGLEKNGEDSLQVVYETLGEMIQNPSIYPDQVFDTLRVFLQSENNEKTYKSAFTALVNILSTKPDMINKVFGLYEITLLKSESYNEDLLKGAFFALCSIVKNQPEYIDNVLNIVSATSEKFDNNMSGSSYYYLYQPLNDIIINYPEYQDKALDLYSGSYSSYKQLSNIKTDISLANKILDKLTADLQSEREINVSAIYEILGNIVVSHPELVDKVFKVFKMGLCSNMSEQYSFGCAYESLSRIKSKHPELSDKVLETLEIGLKSSKNGYYIKDAYDLLENVIKYQPQYADKAFELFKVRIKSNNAEQKSYDFLKNIITSQPQFADKAFELFEFAIKNPPLETKAGDYLCDKHDFQIYEVLRKVYNAKPEFTDRVVDTYKTLLVLDKDVCTSTKKYIISELENIIKTNPNISDKVLDIILLCLEKPTKDDDLNEKAYDVSKDIIELYQRPSEKNVEIYNKVLLSIQANRDLPTSIFEDLKDMVSLNPKLADSAINTLNTFIKSDNFKELYNGNANSPIILDAYHKFLNNVSTCRSDLSEKVLDAGVSCDNLPNKIYLYKSCMKHLPLEETVAKHPEIEQDLRIAHKGRFSNDEEFKYALEHFDVKTLAESMIFRAQQRVMNVLVSTSAQEDGIAKEEAESFRKPDASEGIKDYMENNSDWLIPASFKGAAIFKGYFPAYIKTIQNHNKKNPEDALSVHDAMYWLPEPMSKEANERFAQFIQKNIIYQVVDENGNHKMEHRPLEELKIIAQNWKALENRLQNQNDHTEVAKLKYNEVLSICMSVKYEDQRNDLFAIEAAKHGTPEAEYHNCEDIYLAGLKVPEPFDSKKEFKEGKYTGRFLPRDDPRTLFFGDYTDCCQHYGGAGHACAVSTVKHPFSQLFVVENEQGKIIAGSWTWENTEGKYRDVCFDNIEALGELRSRPEINKIYEQVGEYLTKEENCHKVTIGLGYQDADVSVYERTEAISLPRLYDGYSDARSQVLLTENPDAQPLDKTQETQRYIRDVCFLDMEAMDRVSEAVFPVGDKQLQAPDNIDNMAGFVIEDREKGVVGYCLYEKKGDNEYYISDTAVLEDYRSDKNASSKKLFAEMIRCVREKGGSWYAEMREETSLRYLKAMAARGLAKFEILDDNEARNLGLEPTRRMEYDPKIKASSKVYPVRFEVVRDDVRRATDKLKRIVAKDNENHAETPKEHSHASIEMSDAINRNVRA